MPRPKNTDTAKAAPAKTAPKPRKTRAQTGKPLVATTAAQAKATAPLGKRATQKVLTPEMAPSAVTVPPISVVASVAETAATPAATLKKSEFFDRVATRSGEKKRVVKPILEAALAVLGEALSNGEELNLQPLGKIKVNRRRVDEAAEMLILKLRRNTAAGASEKPTKDALAEDDEDD